MYQAIGLSRKKSVNLCSSLRSIASNVKVKDVKNEAKERDEFGTLSRSGQKKLATLSAEKFLPEDEDGYDVEEFDLAPRKNAFYYKYEIPKYARQGKLGIKKALELYQQMKAHDRLTPDLSSFSPLIYGCAKAGYTKRAFELYEESLKYFSKPTKSTVTCLINACAESPFPQYGIERLKWFKDHLKFDQNYSFNLLQYNCLIKAHGKLGQLEEASKVVQEMLAEGILPDPKTFSMLLIGCASNREAGATLALRVYKRMKLYDVPRSLPIYTLLLKCIRDCQMGTGELVKETLGELPAMTSFDQKLRYKKHLSKKGHHQIDAANFEWLPLLEDLGKSIEVALKPQSSDSTQMKLLSGEDFDTNDKLVRIQDDRYSLVARESGMLLTKKLPNLLSEDHLDLVGRIAAIKFERLNSPSSRLMLFGDMHGFLETMAKDRCKPDVKTFSLILECIRNTPENQMEYFRLSKDYSIQRDLLFYDLLIRHVTNSRDSSRLDRALHFVEEMHKDGIRPNITTFESLAFGCDTMKQAKKLLHDLENCNFVVSKPLIKALFIAALRRYDFDYLNWLLKFSREQNFKPDKSLIERLEETRLVAQNAILKYEKNKHSLCDKPFWLEDETQIQKFDNFKKSLGNWLKHTTVYEEDHPWSQFYVENKSRKEGFHQYVQNFKVLIKAKNEALKKESDRIYNDAQTK